MVELPYQLWIQPQLIEREEGGLPGFAKGFAITLGGGFRLTVKNSISLSESESTGLIAFPLPLGDILDDMHFRGINYD